MLNEREIDESMAYCDVCGTQPAKLSGTEATMLNYYTVVIPYVATGATQWHPTESTGPFSTLTRGAFATQAEADAWARERLCGAPYTVRYCGACCADCDGERCELSDCPIAAQAIAERHMRKVRLMHELIRLTGMEVR